MRKLIGKGLVGISMIATCHQGIAADLSFRCHGSTHGQGLSVLGYYDIQSKRLDIDVTFDSEAIDSAESLEIGGLATYIDDQIRFNGLGSNKGVSGVFNLGKENLQSSFLSAPQIPSIGMYCWVNNPHPNPCPGRYHVCYIDGQQQCCYEPPH